MEEKELVQRSREGDEEAYGALVREYKKKVFHLAYSMTRNRETADDLAQEVFVKAYFALGKFKGQSGFGTWLYRIAMNHIKDYLRRSRKLPSVSLEDFPREPLNAEDESRKRERIQEEEERRKLLHRTLESLPAKYRIILTLRDIQGHSYEEIAAILRISQGTVDSRLHRARKLLRKRIMPFLSGKGGIHELQKG
ncbi:MAG: RNA polymerase sigma factor [Candidatus Aminicenantales bacterium]